jgi:serine/threonine protein kinase
MVPRGTWRDQPARRYKSRVADTIGEYRLVRELGRGGMGEVWLAEHMRLERRVALKILSGDHKANPELLERFKREAEAAMKISHPGVVRVFDFGESNGTFFFAMEVVDGRGLDAALADGPLKPPQAIKAMRELLEALQACHDAGLIHRDLKPANLIIDRTDRLRVLDLGLAKHEDRTLLTREGALLGTPRYMPPEGITGKPSDNRSDLYQVGLILHEMLCAQPAFPHQMPVLLTAIAAGCAAPLPEIPGSSGRVLAAFRDKLIAPDPDQRFPSAGEALAWLNRELAAGSRSAPRARGSRTGKSGALAETAKPGQQSADSDPTGRPSLGSVPPAARAGLAAVAFLAIGLALFAASRFRTPVTSPPPASSAPLRALDLDVDAGPTRITLRFRTERAVRCSASLEGTPITTGEPGEALAHALVLAGLKPGADARVSVRSADGAQLASWAGALPRVSAVRKELFDQLEWVDPAETQLRRDFQRTAIDQTTSRTVGERWKRDLGANCRRPAYQRAVARFEEVRDLYASDDEFSGYDESELTARREKLRTLHFWVLETGQVDPEVPWQALAPRSVAGLPAGAVPLVGAIFGDGGRAAGRPPLPAHPAIVSVPGTTRFNARADSFGYEGRAEYVADAAPALPAVSQLYLAFRGVSGLPTEKVCVRLKKDKQSGHVLGFVWGPAPGRPIDALIRLDPRIAAKPGQLRLQGMHRSSRFVPKGIDVDHVVLYGIP